MDTTDILIKVRKIVRSINLESKKIQKEYGVSIPQVLCLNFLYNAPDYQSTHGKIKNFLNLNASTTSGIIQRLEKKKLVSRLPKSGDKRIVNIALTNEGLQLLEKIPSLLHEQLSEKLDGLDVKRLQSLQEGLDILVDLLNIGEIDAAPVLTVGSDIDGD